MKKILDPWDDASALAQRLECLHVRVYIMIGATEWCARCRELRPQFDHYAQHALVDETWLWLDLVEHGEFIGDYEPENLPMLIVYRGAQLVACQQIEHAGQVFLETVDNLRALDSGEKMQISATSDPGVRSRLLMQGWAVK